MSKEIIPVERIAHAIFVLRQQRVILDYYLAVLYGIETRALKQAVRRNPNRFPSDFMFELSVERNRHRSITICDTKPAKIRRG
jgi:ORF6N domain